MITASLRTQGVLPLVDVGDAASVDFALAALEEAELTCIEVVLRSDCALDVVRSAAARGFLVGAGTVLSAADVHDAADAGSQFVVSPGFDDAVAAAARERGVDFIPGISTPTELMRTRAAGFTTVKVFPVAPLGGPALVRALAGPFAGMAFVPTGGVREGDVSSYLAVPEVLAVGGSWMLPRELLRREHAADVAALTRRAAIAGRQR